MNERTATDLAEEQAALRRVATLVASNASPERIFQAVAEEAGRLLGGRAAVTARYDAEMVTIVGHWDGGDAVRFEVGTRFPFSDPESPVRTAAFEGGCVDDYTDLPGEAARLTRERGYRSSVASPIVADGRTWGALFVLSSRPRHFGADAQRKLGDFTELVALALEAAEAHDQLTASRARIIEASVAERRRLERNLHDGAQQRLVALALDLRLAQRSVRDDPSAAEAALTRIGHELACALEELRELARGLHPSILSDRGLGPALQSLATRAPFQVDVLGTPTRRLPEAIEAAVYYVVAESLTNAAKHSGATAARVELLARDDVLVVEIEDNGSGGADAASGSGVRGLSDRIDALGGTFEVHSPVGAGTIVRARVPLAPGHVSSSPGGTP